MIMIKQDHQNVWKYFQFCTKLSLVFKTNRLKACSNKGVFFLIITVYVASCSVSSITYNGSKVFCTFIVRTLILRYTHSVSIKDCQDCQHCRLQRFSKGITCLLLNCHDGSWVDHGDLYLSARTLRRYHYGRDISWSIRTVF